MPAQPYLFTGNSRNRPVWSPCEVIQTPVENLKPYPNNVRTHTEKSLSHLKGGIIEFGFIMPVVIDGDRNIIAGHGRVEAAKSLGMTAVPTICADHLTPAQVRAYRIADNRLAELSDWNRDALRVEFADLVELQVAGDLDFDVTVTGFDMPEIDLLIGGVDDDTDGEQETVEGPDPAKPAVTRLGDLWILGHHRVLCANSLHEASYEAVLMGETARMAFTDPPYNVPVNGHVRCGNGGAHREFAMASGEMSDTEFRRFLGSFISLVLANLSKGGIAMICMDWRHVEELIAAGKGAGLELINLCVWNKTNGGMGSLYRSKHELVCVFRNPGAAHVNNVELGKHGRNRTNVWDYAGVNSFGKGREADLADHPTVKPTALVADAIMDVTHRGDIVLDCFGGSGSTLLAAEKTGRKARLIELDPLYVDVAIRRWQAMTGQQAVHAETGETFDARAALAKTANTTEAGDVDA
jgi:DNA modification methylase